MNRPAQTDWTYERGANGTDAKFAEFHRHNPHVFETMVARARQLKARGCQNWAIKNLIEMARWDHQLHTNSDEPFKLNNNYSAYYTRLIEHECPDLVGFFHKRRSKADTTALTGVHFYDLDLRQFS